MSEVEIAKIIQKAEKHLLPEGYTQKLRDAALKHGRPFRSHTQVCRVVPKSQMLRKLSKAGA